MLIIRSALTPTRVESQTDVFARLAFAIALLAATAYAIGFNLAPGTRSVTTILLVASVLLIFVLAALIRPLTTSPLLFLVVYISGATAAMHWVGYSQNFDAAFRYIISILALFTFAILPVGDVRSALSKTAGVILAFAGITALVSPPILVAGVVRASPFVGGEDGFHSSAIVVSALLIIIWTSPWSRPSKLIYGVPGVILLIAYGGATEMLMIGVFAIAWTAHKKRWPKWLVVVLSMGLIVGSVFYRDENSVQGGKVGQLGAGALGSGRFDAWQERLNVFLESDVVLQLFGAGAYSDYRVTPLWWWEKKSAHSDIITFVMEFGIVGTSILVLLILVTRRLLSPTGQIALVAVLLGMALSNTLLDRPGLAIFWGLAIYSANRMGSANEETGEIDLQNTM